MALEWASKVQEQALVVSMVLEHQVARDLEGNMLPEEEQVRIMALDKQAVKAQEGNIVLELVVVPLLGYNTARVQ